jgi:flagellar biosynthesis/type III secretory pathway chaperone
MLSATIEHLTRDLLGALRHERQLHDNLIELTEAEREAIVRPAPLVVADGPLPLETIVVQKEQVIAQLTEAEMARSNTSGKLAVALGLPWEARLVDLLPHLGSTIAAVLQAERTTLLARARRLAEANTANAELINAALGTTRAALSYLQSLQGALYQSDGRSGTPLPNRPRFDHHV